MIQEQVLGDMLQQWSRLQGYTPCSYCVIMGPTYLTAELLVIDPHRGGSRTISFYSQPNPPNRTAGVENILSQLIPQVT